MIEYYILFFILGLAIGSFLNVCIYRIPAGKSISAPPSHCMSCGTRLKPADMIPVLSYILLRGRCRYCGTGFSPRYAFVELLTGVIFVLLYHKYTLTVELAAAIYLMTILIAVFFIDTDHRIIPDRLVLAGLAGGVPLILYNLFYPLAFYRDGHWWTPLVGMITDSGFLFLVAVVGLLIYKSDDAMGMGDVKIFAPIGVFLGWKLCILALLLAILLGGIAGLVLILARRGNGKSTIPFGPFIVSGTFVSLMWGWDIIDWYLSSMVY